MGPTLPLARKLFRRSDPTQAPRPFQGRVGRFHLPPRSASAGLTESRAMTRSILYATAAAVLVPLSAYAQTPDDPDDDLPEVVVTATRLPAIVADMPGARVIDRATIDRRGAVFAADILSDVPGLSVVRSGG
ncbi:hypothetical protein B7486_60625, partial [cyanobacterium TDX16]